MGLVRRTSTETLKDPRDQREPSAAMPRFVSLRCSFHTQQAQFLETTIPTGQQAFRFVLRGAVPGIDCSKLRAAEARTKDGQVHASELNGRVAPLSPSLFRGDGTMCRCRGIRPGYPVSIIRKFNVNRRSGGMRTRTMFDPRRLLAQDPSCVAPHFSLAPLWHLSSARRCSVFVVCVSCRCPT